MSRPKLTLLLLACLLAGLDADGWAQPIGNLAAKRLFVRKALPPRPSEEMRTKDPVMVSMLVETLKKSWAWFALGKTQAAVTMGPESRFRFREGLFNSLGLLTKVDLEIARGIFRFASAPPDEGQNIGEIVIETPKRPIHLYGTDVYLRVESNGFTTLVVVEGYAIVRGPGPEVQVKAGYWTTFGPDQSPQPPTRTGRGATVGGFWPGEPELPGPILLDLRSTRLDLPKSLRP